MPNWCENKLEIIGSKKQLEKIINIIKKDNKKNLELLNLSSFIPIPKIAPKGYNVIDKYAQKLDDSYPKWYRQNWYNYNVDYYGTKWIEDINLFLVGDIDVYSKEKNIYHIHLAFETAWSPLNEKFLIKFSKKFNVYLILGYVEPGVGYIGGSIVSKNNYYDFNKDIDFKFNDDKDNWEKFLDWASDELESIYNDLKKAINF